MFCAHCGNQVQTLGAPCPSCGKPASGAPPVEGRPAGVTALIIIGVAVGMISVLGIIAAIAIPNLLNAIDRGRQKRTMADMRMIGTAIEAHGVDHYFYPAADDFVELTAALEPVYIKRVPREDGWRNSFEYLCWQVDPGSAGCDNYVIVSPARDGAFEVSDFREYAGMQITTRDSDCDIVYSNGTFVQYPSGI